MHQTQLNAIELARAVRERIVNFTASDFFVRDAGLADCLREMWSRENGPGNLVSDLWVEGAFPPESSSDTLHSLVSEGVLHPALRDTLLRNKVFDETRPLYKHQSESLRRAHEGFAQAQKPAIAVTAGTGAGKTESFLFPLLNELFRAPAQLGEGVSAMILYPMNALVNDQVERLYNWLKEQDIATLFHFTSETPEDASSANKAGFPKYNACRFRTRNQARGLEDATGKSISPNTHGPVPRILVTNYSMLEYMLCRPRDAVFFGKNLRAIVLDEAHLYTGTLAAEITLLLRRLLLRCGLGSKDVLQFATSATLGTGNLKEFIGKLFTKPSQLVHLIEGKSRHTELSATKAPATPPTAASIAGLPWPNHPLIHADNKGDISLWDADSEELQQWQRCLSVLVAEEHLQVHVATCGSQPARLIHATLGSSPLIHNIERIIRTKKHLPLHDLAQSLFGDAGKAENEATRRLLQLCAAARESASGQPLLGNRIHFLVRSSQGFTVFFDDKKRKAGVAWGKSGFTLVPGHHDRCPETGTTGLTLARCRQCGCVYFIGNETGGMLGPVPPHTKVNSKVLRCIKPGEFLTGEQQTAIVQPFFVFQPTTGKISGTGAEGIAMHELNKCMECFAKTDEIHPFIASHNLLRNILAETMLAAMPEKPGESRLWLPARGRRLLVFSDSRSSAARLGPSLTRQHAIQLIRAAIIRHAPQRDSETITFLHTQLTANRASLAIASSPGLRNTLERQIRNSEDTLAQVESGGSISDWCAAIKGSPLVAELFDVEKSENHTFGEWQQTNWEQHRKNMISCLDFFILRELALRPSWPNISLETLGLVEVVYPGLERLSCPNSILGKLPQDIARRFEANWPALIASMLDTLRTDRAITLGSESHDALYSDGTPVPVGRWFSLEESFQSTLIAFAGKKIEHRRNAFLATLLRGKIQLDVGQRDTLVMDIFFAVFGQLRDATEQKTLPWLQIEQRQTKDGAAPALRMDASKLAFRRPARLFQCARTGQIWPRAIEHDAPATVRLDLQPITAEKLDADPRIGRHRTELQQDPAFATGIWGEEHSAQLAPDKNRRLQDIFKAGLRNILSSTTTLELGIDIGGLHAVLMANLPPGKANYLQRAGRAGRRADGSAAVVSFIRPLPYEQAVFHDFGHFLGSHLRNPTVYLDRERIVARHWRATLLGTFFQSILPKGKAVGAMRAYGTMGTFCKLSAAPYWDWKRDKNKPDLPKLGTEEKTSARFIVFLREQAQSDQSTKWNDVLVKLREGCPDNILDGTAVELLTDAAHVFEEAIQQWEKEYDCLLKEWKNIPNDGNYGAANSLRYQLNILHEITVIEALADAQVLPRYGFPIGLNRLHVKVTDERRQRVREEDQFRLERSSIQALREYVPGARLMAGNRVITSRGLCKDWTGNNVDKGFGLRSQLYMCASGHSFYGNHQKNEPTCPLCAKPQAGIPQSLLFPRNGFTTAAWDPPKYGSESEMIGQITCQTLAFREQGIEQKNDYKRISDFADIPHLNAEWRQVAEILVTNPGNDNKGFAICTKCGFSESEKYYAKGQMNLPSGFERHASLFSIKEKPTCWRSEDSAPILRNQILAARQNTDILLMDWSQWLQFDALNHRAIHVAIAAAMRLVGAQILELDLREIGIMTNIPAGTDGTGLGIALYDDTPGGSGHVHELMKIGRNWLEKAYEILHGTPEHHKSCHHGCLECILSFDASDSPEAVRPDRRGACDMLAALLQHSDWTPPGALLTNPPPDAVSTPVNADNKIRKLKRKLELRSRKASPVERKRILQILEKIETGIIPEQDIIALETILET
jgi:ATP-dependent helicase YprA (DUF1998 family)